MGVPSDKCVGLQLVDKYVQSIDAKNLVDLFMKISDVLAVLSRIVHGEEFGRGPCLHLGMVMIFTDTTSHVARSTQTSSIRHHVIMQAHTPTRMDRRK